MKINSQCIYGRHSISSSSKITQYDGRRARRYQKFPSECYVFLTNKHYCRSHLVIISVANLRAALCPLSFWLYQFPKTDHVISSFLLYNNFHLDQNVCEFIKQTFFFPFWCKKTLNPDEFFQKPSSNIPNMCPQEADGTRYTWSSDDRLLFSTILLWERCYCAEILQSFAGEFLMV